MIGSTAVRELPHGLLLGWQQGKASSRTPIIDDNREGHLVTIAPTGAGKGVCSIIPALLNWRGPVIVVDPRGENYAVTAARRRSMGQQVHVLDPFGITGSQETARLNPLDLIDPLSGSVEDDAAAIASCITAGRTFAQDHFWDERAEALIASLIAEQFATMRDLFNEPTLGEVREKIARGGLPADHDPSLLNRLRDPDAQKHGKISQFQFGSERTRSSIFSTASSHLGFLRSGPVQECLSLSTISLLEVTRGDPITIYLVLPPDKLRSHSGLLRLWLGAVLAAIAKRRRTPAIPTLLLVDEAAQLGELDHLRSAITLMRGYGLRVWTFWQDLTQLKQVYPRDWENILNNSTTQQLFGAATPYAMAQLRDHLGSSWSKPLPAGASDDMVLCRGGRLEAIGRPNYLRDRCFGGLAAPNPFYPPPRSAEIVQLNLLDRSEKS